LEYLTVKKNLVITGTSSGLGLESSILFAKNGYKVFATMRDISKSGALKDRIEKENLDIDVLQLDVTNEASVQCCINQIIGSAGRIDVLINNAGGGFAKTTEQTTEEEMKWLMVMKSA
jgi:short-subunit dehydrogenase